MPRAASSAQCPDKYMCSLVESRPLTWTDDRGRAVVGGGGPAEVGGQRGALVGDGHAGDPRVLEVECSLLELEHASVGRDPVRVGVGEHAFGLAEVVRGPGVELPGRAGVAGLLGVVGLRDGPAIAGGHLDDDAFLGSMSTMVGRYLLGP